MWEQIRKCCVGFGEPAHVIVLCGGLCSDIGVGGMRPSISTAGRLSQEDLGCSERVEAFRRLPQRQPERRVLEAAFTSAPTLRRRPEPAQ